MAKYLVKLSKFGGQHRVTIPRGLIDEADWFGVEFVLLEHSQGSGILMRRFIDGESLENESQRDRDGSD